MRMMMAWIVGLGSLLLAGLAAAGDFEGIIVMKETSEGTTTQQVWYLKGDRLRFEEAGQDADNSAMIFDAKKKVMYSLHHDDKIYLEIPTADSSTPDPMEDMLVKKTGTSENVAGHACEIYRTTDKTDGSTGEVCMARGITSVAMSALMGMQAGSTALLPARLQEMFKDGGFPIKGISRNGQGTEDVRWEAVKVEKKRLDDALFAPPAHYKKQEMKVLTPESGGVPTEGAREGREERRELR